MTLLIPTHWCRHCNYHQKPCYLVDEAYCPICFSTELEELKEFGDEQ
jgi:predicted Zn-ribbon and HTH transcriptional regulator